MKHLKDQKEIVCVTYGSRLYGTSTPTSDFDYKAVHLPAGKDILLQQVKKTIHTNSKVSTRAKNTANDIDRESFSFNKFAKMLAEGDTIATELLFVPDHLTIHQTDEWKYILDNKKIFLSNECAGFVGYVNAQCKKYSNKGDRVAAIRLVKEFFEEIMENYHLIKVGEFANEIVSLSETNKYLTLIEIEQANGTFVTCLDVCGKAIPYTASVKTAFENVSYQLSGYGERALMAEQNKGLDWKAISHAVRIGRETLEFMETGELIFPRIDAEYLLKIKTGELSYSEISEELERILGSVEDAKNNSVLPPEPDYAAIDQLVMDMFMRQISD